MSGIKELALRFSRPNAEPGSEMKSAAYAVVAFDPDVAVHHLDQSFGNREPETGAAVLSVVELSAWLKAWNRRAVCSGVMPMPLSRTENLRFTLSESFFHQRDRHHDLALFGELHRVVDKVDQDLTEPQGVANEIRTADPVARR